MRHRMLVLSIALAGFTLAACDDDDDVSAPTSHIVSFAASLTPAGEPGPLNGNPQGSGTFTATLDTVTNVFTWTSTFSGLTSTITNGHIHGPFIPGGAATTAGVILDFNTAGTFTGRGTSTSGSTTGTVTLNASFNASAQVNGDSIRKLILAGRTYVNIHTQTNGGGEIRGQLLRTQ